MKIDEAIGEIRRQADELRERHELTSEVLKTLVEKYLGPPGPAYWMLADGAMRNYKTAYDNMEVPKNEPCIVCGKESYASYRLPAGGPSVSGPVKMVLMCEPCGTFYVESSNDALECQMDLARKYWSAQITSLHLQEAWEWIVDLRPKVVSDADGQELTEAFDDWVQHGWGSKRTAMEGKTDGERWTLGRARLERMRSIAATIENKHKELSFI